MNLKNTSSFIFTMVFLVTSITIHEDSKADIIVSKIVSKIGPTHFAHVDRYKAFNETRQLSLLTLTLNRLERLNNLEIDTLQCKVKDFDEPAYLDKARFHDTYSIGKTTPDETNTEQSNTYVQTITAQIKHNKDIDQMYIILPIIEALDINKQAPKLPKLIDTVNSADVVKQQQVTHKVKNEDLSQSDIANNIDTKLIGTDHVGYWQTVHSIESKQGKLLYRPRNKARNCSFTRGPCGHHQLTVRALKDIGCKSLQCRKDRLDYKKSLKLSKKLLALNEERLLKNGISKLEDYQKYLIHQQGAYGIKSIIQATKGKKVLSKNLKKNMANNSPYSYKQLKNMGSKAAAKKFMQHWENKWVNEKVLIVASETTTSTDNLINPIFIPTFDDSELNLALNIRF